MNKIIVLGAGMVGSAIAIDLSDSHQVTLCDIDAQNLNRAKQKCDSLTVLQLDVTQSDELTKTLQPYDIVVCAVPGFLGYATLKSIIMAGKDVVDISFFPENALELSDLAIKHNVIAVVDCGVAPGMDNIILGRYNEIMKLTDFECLVGGLPKVKTWPFCYKAPFSPIDVIEEYTRPARYVEGGKIVARPPLTDCEYVEFEKVGTLESFNSDGLRSILFTMSHIPNMKEKTLRYPGHAEYIKVLKESGFFDSKSIQINGQQVKPIDFTSKILFKAWKLEENEEEITVMRVKLTGKNQNGKKETVIYHLLDEFNHETGTSSMARTTGYTASAVTNLILNKQFSYTGLFPPELVGKHQNCFDYIIQYLAERNINYVKTTEVID